MKTQLQVLLMVCCVAGASCAGVSRDISSRIATDFGADWIVVQYRFDGSPINCWKLLGVGVSNEEASGVYQR